MQFMKLSAALLATSAMGVSACSTPTSVTDVWRDPSYAAGPMHKVLVAAKTPNETNRRNFEDSFANSLSHHGVQAIASYRVFETPAPQRPVVRQYLQDNGYDGAVVAEFKGVQTVTTVLPTMDMDAYWGSRFYGGYYASDAYVTTDQFVKVETTLWDTKSGKLVWSVTTQTDNPWNSSDAISSVISKLTSTMSDAGLIPSMRVSRR